MRARIEAALLAQRGGLLLWVPICLSLGIGLYFALPREPREGELAALALICGAALLAALRAGEAFRPLWLAPVLAAGGLALVLWQATSVAAPVLGFRYYGPIEGRLVQIDRSGSDALRLTLDRVVLERVPPDRTPARVRVSLHGDQVIERFDPGEVLILTGHLSPPSGAAEPGGFDFRRHAWFQRIGAVGYTRTPVLRWSEPGPRGLSGWLFAQRIRIAEAVRDELPGEAGAFAAAILTGDRTGIPLATLEALRASNLAHLLAISGLHMGLLTGVVFTAVRAGLALWPRVALRWPGKQVAAVAALLAGGAYLALSGGNVATERAYVMVAVVLGAVLLGRRALTLRAVAIAAIIILARDPQALTGPGFQMSFSATAGLVLAFGALRRVPRRGPRWARAAGAVALSSAVAGFATAPFAAAHFNQISHYGLAANLATVPLMGIWVMPAAVLAAVLAPVGLGWIGLWLMEPPLRWTLWVAERTAALDGAVGQVPAPPGSMLPLLALGLAWLALWQGRARLAGALPVAAAVWLWAGVERPDLLVAESGALMGLRTAEGRSLSKARGDGFVAGIWLENDGDAATQEAAFAREGLRRAGRVTRARLGDWEVVQVTGKTALAALPGCGGGDILVTDQPLEAPRPCLGYDLAALRRSGALALRLAPDGALRIVTAAEVSGDRLWSPLAEGSRGLRLTPRDVGAERVAAR